MNDTFLRPTAHRQPHAAHNRRSGLTVLELVSALALFVIVLGTLMVALNAATDIWSRNASATRSMQTARLVLDRLATDLASAVGRKPADPASAPASEINADEPNFIAEQKSEYQTGLFFVRQRSPLEVSGERALSLELVAYCWTTNGLSRYAVPVVSTDPGRVDPPVTEQLKAFKADVFALPAATNLVASSVVAFVPLVYKPTSALITPSDSLPADPLNKNGETVQMADLPDYIDVFLACVDRQSSSAFSVTNYLTSRITLPAAQASRLP